MLENDVNSRIKSQNRRAMLRLIRQSGSISRVQLAQRLKLSKSTVTENVAHLLQTGVLVETGTASSQATGGRRPVLLRINGNYRYIVAAELALHEPIFALADLNGSVLQARSMAMPMDAPYAARLRMCRDVVRHLLRDGGVPPDALAVIALSSPGAYNAHEKSFQLNPEFQNWNVNQLTADLETAFSTEVFRVNDVNAATVGEYSHGAGRGCQNLLFVSCGMGIGMGVVTDGALYTGTYGSAGEIARVRSGPAGVPLRTLVEIPALLERVQGHAPPSTRKAFGVPAEELNFEDLVRLWRMGDGFIRACVDDIADLLGHAVSFAVSLLNSDKVVFGGDYIVFEEQMVPRINQVVRKGAFDPVEVVPSSLQQRAGLQGLLSMAADAMLDKIATERE